MADKEFKRAVIFGLDSKVSFLERDKVHSYNLEEDTIRGFTKNLAKILYCLTDYGTEWFLTRLDHLRRFGGIDEAIDFVDEVAYARFNLSRDLSDCVKYVTADIAIERKFGEEARTNFDYYVRIAAESGLPLKSSIKFGNALVKNNRKKAGYYIAKSIGCKEETARNFGYVYSTALERFSANEATSLFGPAYFKVAQKFFGDIRKTDLNKKKSEIAASFVGQGLSLISGDIRYTKLFGNMVDEAKNIIKNRMTINAYESWLYALGCAELRLNGGDVSRFKENVYNFVEKRFSFRNALLLSIELEDYNIANNSYKKDAITIYLSSQREQGINEDHAVRNAIRELQTDNLRGLIIAADGTTSRIETGKTIKGAINF